MALPSGLYVVGQYNPSYGGKVWRWDGSSFTQIGSWTGSYNDLRGGCLGDDGALYVGGAGGTQGHNTYGVIRRTEDGSSWTVDGSWTTLGHQVMDLCTFKGDVYAVKNNGGDYQGMQVVKRASAGTWNVVKTVAAADAHYAHAIFVTSDGSTLIAAPSCYYTTYRSKPKWYYSTDGSSWSNGPVVSSTWNTHLVYLFHDGSNWRCHIAQSGNDYTGATLGGAFSSAGAAGHGESTPSGYCRWGRIGSDLVTSFHNARYLRRWSSGSWGNDHDFSSGDPPNIPGYRDKGGFGEWNDEMYHCVPSAESHGSPLYKESGGSWTYLADLGSNNRCNALVGVDGGRDPRLYHTMIHPPGPCAW